jgi:hypothetical protein
VQNLHPPDNFLDRRARKRAKDDVILLLVVLRACNEGFE